MDKRGVPLTIELHPRGPRVRMQHGPLVKRVLKGTPEAHLPRGVACSPGKIFKSKVARIALVTISASRYNRKII